MKTFYCKVVLALVIGVTLLGASVHVSAQSTWVTKSVDGYTPRTYPCAAEIGGKIYVIGGHITVGQPGALSVVEVYNPTTDSWASPVTKGTFTARGGASANVVNGKIYVIGGQDNSGTTVNTVEVFDPATNTWSTPTTTGTFTARHRHVAGVVLGKLIIVAGGQGTSGYNVPLQVFDTESNSWSSPKVTGTFTPRRAALSAVMNNKLYVFGGYNGSQALNSLEMFDPETDMWSNPTTDNGNVKRYAGTAAVINNNIYLIGGFDLVAMVEDVEIFNTTTKEWDSEITNGVFSPRSGLVSAVVNGTIYAIGGATLTSIPAVNESLKPKITDVHITTDNQNIIALPNPATDNIRCVGLPYNTTSVQIVSTLGEHILVSNTNQMQECVFDISTLVHGVYFMHITTTNGKYVRAFVKE